MSKIDNDKMWASMLHYQPNEEEKERLGKALRVRSNFPFRVVMDILIRGSLREQGLMEKDGVIEVYKKFKVGDCMRTKKEAEQGIRDGLPIVVHTDENYYYCNNEVIAIKDQEDYEFPPFCRANDAPPIFKVGNYIIHKEDDSCIIWKKHNVTKVDEENRRYVLDNRTYLPFDEQEEYEVMPVSKCDSCPNNKFCVDGEDCLVEKNNEGLTAFEKALKHLTNEFVDSKDRMQDVGAKYVAKKLLEIAYKQFDSDMETAKREQYKKGYDKGYKDAEKKIGETLCKAFNIDYVKDEEQ